MKAEELEVIARGMGYRACIEEPYDIHSQPKHVRLDNRDEYNPLTNDTQCMEIINKLLDMGYLLTFNMFPFSEDCYSVLINETKSFSGKTINEAVCKAALEYFKEAK